jgi:hypothetical protein
LIVTSRLETPARDMVDPTERSTKPAANTKVIPQLIMPIIATWRSIFSIFAGVINLGVKTASTAIRRMKTIKIPNLLSSDLIVI